jgi:DNA-directed RNA polymerase subunit M/transcription elongation factor TFIIS
MSAVAAKRAPARKKVVGLIPEDIEALRTGMRPALLEKFRVSVMENRKRAGVPDDWKPGQTETDLITRFEDALHTKAVTAWKEAGPRGDSLKHVYVKVAVTVALKALGTPCDQYPDSSLAVCLIRGDIDPERAATDEVLHAHRHDTPRDICRRLLLKSLLKYALLTEDRSRALAIAAEIEASCYNAVIQHCKVSESPFRRSWESEQFAALYSDRCGTVNSHIDPDSSVGRAYGTPIMNRLLSGEIRARAVGAMTAAELCPGATEHERSEIELRNQQKVDEKASDLFTCPVPTCRARRCTYREVHTRSLDEPADIHCRCLECGHRFKVR